MCDFHPDCFTIRDDKQSGPLDPKRMIDFDHRLEDESLADESEGA
jgi:hypothetical protein